MAVFCSKKRMIFAFKRKYPSIVIWAVKDTELITVGKCVIILDSRKIISRIVDQRNRNFLVWRKHVESSEIKEKFVCGRVLSKSCSFKSRFRANIGIGCGVSIPGVTFTDSGVTAARDSVRVDSAGGNSEASKNKDSNLHEIKLEYFWLFFDSLRNKIILIYFIKKGHSDSHLTSLNTMNLYYFFSNSTNYNLIET